MGGWQPGRGRISLLAKAKAYARETLFDAVNLPHGVVVGPDKRVYVGYVGGVFRFDPANPAASRTDVIGGSTNVPAPLQSGRHLLVALVFDANNDLFLNAGSASDNCEAEDGTPPDPDRPCAEGEGTLARGAIRKYTMSWPAGRVAAVEVYAEGLRNSTALAVHRASNTLLQGENSRDAINRRDPKLRDDLLPHDEINLVRQGRHYGWPYCYDNNVASPEYPKADCSKRAKPLVLLPPHVAPLGMAIDNDARLPAPFTGHMLLTYHGYRKDGHRVVAFRLNPKGLPVGKPVDVISGWGAKRGANPQPQGAPVDLRIAPDGSVFISEDRNGTLLRLARAAVPAAATTPQTRP
jgi:glucose/arabinose dehydrogenase